MRKKGKHLCAIAGAVMAYIKLEEEGRRKARVPRGISSASLWSISARQDTMQLRKLYQLGFPKK